MNKYIPAPSILNGLINIKDGFFYILALVNDSLIMPPWYLFDAMNYSFIKLGYSL